MAIQISGTTVIDNSTNVNVGAAGSFHVTDSGAFVKNNAVGLGTTDTTGRDAGVGTSKGTLIYNETDLTVQVYDGTQWINGLTSPFVATGGTEDTTSRSGYKIHTFTSPGSFSVTEGQRNVEYLIIAGGGGGGYTAGGGGGAGGYKTGTSMTITPGTYPVTIGGGGAGATVDGNNGSKGADSSFNSVTSEGGGFGRHAGASGGDGGSGGGSGYTTGTGGSGTDYPGPNQQGFPGGDSGGGGGPQYTCAGGGGAGGAGESVIANTPGGDGGIGQASSINGTSTTRAGGGGGSSGGGGGTGGPGGGGNGGFSLPGTGGTAGTPNTGGGGGGTGHNGGSGIVIIAYPNA